MEHHMEFDYFCKVERSCDKFYVLGPYMRSKYFNFSRKEGVIAMNINRGEEIEGVSLDINGLLHRGDGKPAIDIDNQQVYAHHGLITRQDEPAVMTDTFKMFVVNSTVHNDKGPAIIFTNGSVIYMHNGYVHRKGAEAVKTYNGDTAHEIWAENGLLHRIGGPAVQGGVGYKIVYAERGLPHRLDGPATIDSDGCTKYYIKGVQYTRDDYDIKIRRLLMTESIEKRQPPSRALSVTETDVMLELAAAYYGKSTPVPDHLSSALVYLQSLKITLAFSCESTSKVMIVDQLMRDLIAGTFA
jgi:hypothetical protein